MISQHDAIACTAERITEIFGKEYLRDNFKGKGTFGVGVSSDNKHMIVFYGIKTVNDFPNSESTVDGWVVYADFRVNSETGQIDDEKYAFPDECKI